MDTAGVHDLRIYLRAVAVGQDATGDPTPGSARSAARRSLDYGCLPLDNGIVERLHVRTALTRKNFLLAGSDAGGERAAIAYTILGSCRLAGVDPRE
jgi:hypothetical protein